MNLINKNEDSFLTYQGPFSMRIISSLGKYLADNLKVKPDIRMNLYRVFIEQCQNVALYSIERIVQDDDTDVGSGTMLIKLNSEFVSCTTVNLINKEHCEKLNNNCSSINQSDFESLIKLKEKLRRESSLSEGGAHIGLISIKLYSMNQLDFEIIQNENDYYFQITSKISIAKNN